MNATNKTPRSFSVVYTDYSRDGWHDTYRSSEYASFREAHTMLTKTNEKLGIGKTPDHYTRAESIQLFNATTNKRETIRERDYAAYLAEENSS